MIAERLKADRALPTQTDRHPGNLRLIMNDDRELPTAPENLKPSEPPLMPEMPPSAKLPVLRPSPDSYADWAMSQLLARVRGLESDRGAMTMADFEAALDRNAQKITHETNANIDMLRSSIGGLQQSVDALVTRVGNTEREVAANRTETSEQLVRLELDMAAMRSQLDRLDREVAILKAVKDATTEAPAKLDNPASG